MRLIALAAVVLAAGCGGNTDANPTFLGDTPDTEAAKKFDKDGKWLDERGVFFTCPACKIVVQPGTAVCPDQQNCGADITWKSEYACTWCGGKGQCEACWSMEQDKIGGKCINCKGEGYVAFIGKTAACPNCKDKKVCPICQGSQKCDVCNGAKKLSLEALKARVKSGKADSE